MSCVTPRSTNGPRFTPSGGQPAQPPNERTNTYMETRKGQASICFTTFTWPIIPSLPRKGREISRSRSADSQNSVHAFKAFRGISGDIMALRSLCRSFELTLPLDESTVSRDLPTNLLSGIKGTRPTRWYRGLDDDHSHPASTIIHETQATRPFVSTHAFSFPKGEVQMFLRREIIKTHLVQNEPVFFFSTKGCH